MICAGIGRVGQDFLIAGDRGVEADFADRLARSRRCRAPRTPCRPPEPGPRCSRAVAAEARPRSGSSSQNVQQASARPPPGRRAGRRQPNARNIRTAASLSTDRAELIGVCNDCIRGKLPRSGKARVGCRPKPRNLGEEDMLREAFTERLKAGDARQGRAHGLGGAADPGGAEGPRHRRARHRQHGRHSRRRNPAPAAGHGQAAPRIDRAVPAGQPPRTGPAGRGRRSRSSRASCRSR